jgi:precorrin-2 dehydrogenase / sirohydrochlorin ferrochelatase
VSGVTQLPIVLDGRSVSALVVGGGNVALRKVRGLLDAGAHVRVVAREISPELSALATQYAALTLVTGDYSTEQLEDALVIVAATDDPETNARVASDARAHVRLVTVADAPELGNCTTPAVHRRGDLLVAVTAGGVPGVAARVRDAIAQRVDARYGSAVRALAMLRRRLLADGNRERWRAAAAVLIGEDFCASVESGVFDERIAQWR